MIARWENLSRDQLSALDKDNTIVLLPMLLFYLAFHKQIIEGVSRGGIKG